MQVARTIAVMEIERGRNSCLIPGWLFVFSGSGYLEGKELQNLIQELQQARKKAGLVGLSLQPRKKTFNLKT